ncbi:MAG: hypothetical protein LQ338_006767 [Usnochroma carphineum]|nr:MAG: hypothetical protein LQ338_006767 [Usnochroma carphineum]
MADIYRRAKRTIVWLGEATMLEDDRSAIVDATERMNFRPVEREWSNAQDQDILKDLIGFKAEGKSLELGQRRRQLLAEFLNRPWFTRAWVFQEVVVAKSGIILCGSLEMDMEIFINLLDGVCNLDLQEVGGARSIIHSSTGYKPMFAVYEARFESRNGMSSPTKSRWLATLWQAMVNLKAKDPRDKIYAFLAFQDPQTGFPVVPSYNLPVETVYTDAARRSIQSAQSLDVLELALKHEEPTSNLPSWVPDFSKPLPSLPFMTHNPRGSNFQASRGIPYSTFAPTPSFECKSELKAQGHIISTIESICPTSFPSIDLAQTLHQSLRLEEVSNWVASRLKAKTQPLLSHLLCQTLRTLLAEGAAADDTPNNMNYNSAEILAVYLNEPTILQAKLAGLVPAPALRSGSPTTEGLKIQYRYYQWIKTISEIVVRKNFFLTRHGDMGLTYEGIREGDAVVVLLGSKTPTVVRKAEGEDRWQFVAQCYLNGWMRGEKYEGREWTEESAETFMLV